MRNFLSFLLIISASVAYSQAFYDGPGWQQNGEITYTAFGWSMSNAGDVNGDGYPDMVVSAIDYSFPEATNGEEGKLYLYYGGPEGLSTEPAWSFESNNDSSVLGFSTSGGDLNGDGFSDVVAGCLQWTGDQYNEGRIYLWYGSAAGLNPGEPDWSLDFDQVFALLGSGVALDGDINGDGYNDLFLSAKMWDEPEIEEGKTWLYWGSPDGPVESGWSWQANQEGAISGFPVNYAGDVNGDGFDDVVIGANQYNFDLIDDGLAVAFYGSATGLNTDPDWMASSGQKKANFGHWVDGAGDVNGDGYDDVVVAALLYESDSASHNEGRIFVYHGSNSGLSTEVNWFGDINQAEAQFGYSCAGAGDINNDGYDDVIGGAKYWDNGETDEGGAFVWFGSPDGLELDYCFSAEGNQDGGFFGRHVGGNADYNNDGYSDFMVGAYRYTELVEADGKAFAYYGAPRPADFYFDADTFCIDDINSTPIITGFEGGVFASDDLIINTESGEINLTATGFGGPYTISYSVDGYCAVSKKIWIQDANNDSTFTYGNDTLCQITGDIIPTILLPSSGTFYSDDITIDEITGTINTPDASLGWHTIFYEGISNAGCTFLNSIALYIEASPTINLPYDTACITLSEITCVADISGGIFSSPDAVINSITGAINLTATGVGGPYHILYTINNICAANEIIFYIDEPDNALATFYFEMDTLCLDDENPIPIITGITGGNFTSSTATVNPITGTVDVVSSGVGEHIIQYEIITNSGCILIDLDTIFIENPPIVSFNYEYAIYLIGETNPTPEFLSTPGIITATPAGLIFADLNGTIDLINSEIGVYSITNFIATANCDSSYTQIVTIQPPCENPDGFMLHEVDSNSATFIWNSNTYYDNYFIHIIIDGDTITYSTTDTIFTFNDLNANTNYLVFLSINCSEQTTSKSNDINFTTTAISNNDISTLAIQLFPNPTDNDFTIVSPLLNKKCLVTLNNTEGMMVSFLTVNQNNNTYIVSTTNLPAGCYYLTITDGEYTVRATVIIK